jgi:hypothetical protein
MGVHLVFFLHVTTGPDNTNNVLALAFGVLIVILVAAGSLWIMADLNANLMHGMTHISGTVREGICTRRRRRSPRREVTHEHNVYRHRA